jgi:glycosyltransferase EpsE
MTQDNGNEPLKRPVVSVLMACRNSTQTYLEQAVESIRAQSLTNFEFLIRIDGDLGVTQRKYLNEVTEADGRVQIVDSPRAVGLAGAMNQLARQARSEYLARMDDDDVSDPDRLMKQVQVLEEDRLDLVGSACVEIDDVGNASVVKNMPLDEAAIRSTLRWRSPFIHPSIIIRKSVFESLGGYDEGLLRNQDYDLWFRFVDSGFHARNMSETLLRWRRSSGAMRRRSFSLLKWDLIVKSRHLRRSPFLIPSVLLTVVLRSLPAPLLEFAYRRLRPGVRKFGNQSH